MTPLVMILEILAFGLIAGLIGSLAGLGGGAVLIPLLTLFMGVSMAYAAGASLISTIATSSGAASAYIRDRVTNVRIGMGLEIATTAGSIVGSLTAGYIYSHGLAWILYALFGATILFSLIPTASRGRYELPRPIPPMRRRGYSGSAGSTATAPAGAAYALQRSIQRRSGIIPRAPNDRWRARDGRACRPMPQSCSAYGTTL
ncbi:MAG: sulfite exporter TauE/SafE family protein [Nitrososphaeria archaeon]